MNYKTASPDRYDLLKSFARENRKNQTLAEQVLWNQLRNKTLGVKFLRQYIIGAYIVDFVSLECSLVVEVDGAYHAERQQMENDAIRSMELGKIGFKVIRFTNEEVLYRLREPIMVIIDNMDKLSEKNNSLPNREGWGGSSTLFDKIWDAHVVQQV